MVPWIIVGVLLIFLAAIFIRLRFRKSAVFEEFEEQFPGRCAVCAFHQFSIHEGRQAPGTVPEDHRCKEGFRRFRGMLH